MSYADIMSYVDISWERLVISEIGSYSMNTERGSFSYIYFQPRAVQLLVDKRFCSFSFGNNDSRFQFSSSCFPIPFTWRKEAEYFL